MLLSVYFDVEWKRVWVTGLIDGDHWISMKNILCNLNYAIWHSNTPILYSKHILYVFIYNNNIQVCSCIDLYIYIYINDLINVIFSPSIFSVYITIMNCYCRPIYTIHLLLSFYFIRFWLRHNWIPAFTKALFDWGATSFGPP